MATLTNADYHQIAVWVRSQPDIKTNFRTWTISRAQLQAGLQAMEDWFVGAFSVTPAGTWRAAIEAQTGATTVSRATDIARAWAAWRQGR